MPCSVCKQTGHNARTCQSELAMSPIFDDKTVAKFRLDEPEFNVEDELLKWANELQEYDAELANQKPKDECIICYETVGDGEVRTKCGHIYCVGCFVKHMRTASNCAYCREPICEAPQKKRLSEHIQSAMSDRIAEETSEDITDQIRARMIHGIRMRVAKMGLMQTELVQAIEDEFVQEIEATNFNGELWVMAYRAGVYYANYFEA